MRTKSVRAVAHSIFFLALVTRPLRLNLICDALGSVLLHHYYTKLLITHVMSHLGTGRHSGFAQKVKSPSHSSSTNDKSCDFTYLL